MIRLVGVLHHGFHDDTGQRDEYKQYDKIPCRHFDHVIFSFPEAFIPVASPSTNAICIDCPVIAIGIEGNATHYLVLHIVSL